ncbi:heavy-metal-associated domain-containing protein [Flavobacterium sp. IMCC34852]|uniref:Heavy-metal-associated domain-containing protein n=1 Tax=Flavobacterium rivulicola TaxID=2732161 RepID=A0A7Y3R825_9FLAO|nr:cation transporter [Flavobacterium sp. IMCC34852]NNT71592.1 heavy-metal-associated domain-containing protein [Flavobacterium sp. IMCC34852]
MKNVLKSVLLVVTVFLISNVAMAQKTNQKVVIKTILNCDHCKECETCGLKFKTEMLKIKGVKMYELDDKKMTFTIYYNPKKTDLQAIKTAISKLGYDADDVKATPEGIASLDGCCKA